MSLVGVACAFVAHRCPVGHIWRAVRDVGALAAKLRARSHATVSARWPPGAGSRAHRQILKHAFVDRRSPRCPGDAGSLLPPTAGAPGPSPQRGDGPVRLTELSHGLAVWQFPAGPRVVTAVAVRVALEVV